MSFVLWSRSSISPFLLRSPPILTPSVGPMRPRGEQSRSSRRRRRVDSRARDVQRKHAALRMKHAAGRTMRHALEPIKLAGSRC